MTAISLFDSSPLFAQQGHAVHGVVTDSSGTAINAASVLNVNTGKGTFTDQSGSFSIDVEKGQVLEVSYIGYQTKKITYSGEANVSVVLFSAVATNLNDVVVIGYGTQRKEAVTGSVASIGGSALREVPSANFTSALQGRIAGVTMTQTSTKPGATMQIRIRGTRSINATNDPLIVLDGIPFQGSISDISTDDIKSIDILKDASATAIYGSRGANGVILITTNSGGRNQKAQISYSGYFGMNKAVKFPMMNATQFAALRAEANMNNAGADEPTDSAGNYTTSTDWQDLFFKTGLVNSHDLSIIGGTQNGSYKFGAGFYNDQSVVPLSWYKRYSLRGSVDQKIGIFRLGFTTNNNFSFTNGASIGLYNVLAMSPLANPYDSTGAIKPVLDISSNHDQYWTYTRSTLDALGDRFADLNKGFASYNSAYAEVEIPGVQGLKVRVNLGGEYRQSNSGNYTGEGVFSNNPLNPSNASIGNSTTYSWTDENLVMYDRTFGKHQIDAVALYSAEQDYYNSSSISRKNIASDQFQYFNLGQSSTSLNDDITINPANQGYSVSGLLSYMGRVMYSYDSRYMISATLRSDGSSHLASGHQWHTYPAISAGWNIAKESFMKRISWIDELKLRLGFGQTSNQSVPAYSTLGSLTTVPYNFGQTGYATGYYVSTLPNPTLGWEYSTTQNAGLDFTFFHNRLSGTVEYYSTRTKDLLLSVNLPSTSGVGSYIGNVGQTSNKGWELSLNGTIINNVNGWTWDAGFNIYGNKNKIVKLASGETQDIADLLFVGHPLNVIYDYKKIGIWQQNDSYLSILEPGSSNKPGMIKVQYTGDYNADGSPTRAISSADMQIMNADPVFMGGFNTHVGWKGIDLTIVGIFQDGGILNSTLYGASGYLNLEDGRRNNINIDYWTPTNTNAKFPDPNGPKNSNNPKYGSTLGYFSGSYLKISTVTLGYNFDSKWMKKAGIKRLRPYFTVQNALVLFSPYHKQSGMDPQTNSYANDGSTMAVPYSSVSRLLTVGYNTPSTHNYILGINITF
ncbi:SusC/RagA family TonB-linked outer membrane protein [Arachidicoccus ginsenosidimutans]|uniref:SusC/RagA family TonB-linked outer membrane protein n=1 Tax=Arachidicoccus sp. BS20 TaxID=1850526 RepID=UPI0009ED8B06|nr:TonB-dependent receptor [Arachidicoccus sp. BS20]